MEQIGDDWSKGFNNDGGDDDSSDDDDDPNPADFLDKLRQAAN